MEIKKGEVIGVIAGAILLGFNFIFLREEKVFFLLIAVAFIIAAFPFVAYIVLEGRKEKENNEMFLEFTRNLVESVKSGTPISKGVLNLRDKYYGTLTPHIRKLANQISIGIPLRDALETFARDVDSIVIRRAVTLISEAEKAGGEIEGILASVTKSISQIEDLKKERESAIASLVVQGYVIFMVFIAIMLIMQFKILPVTEGLTTGAEGGGDGLEGFISFGQGSLTPEQLARPLLLLLLTQGIFTGLAVGKLAEGTIKSGVKHSFIMTALSLLTYGVAKLF
ncbi:type II secretion system F family protein [Candidatus Pacearchaeota archaeon]|nr:type II secretion system F family protein [Candidatus Pacearchaeota archaeon]